MLTPINVWQLDMHIAKLAKKPNKLTKGSFLIEQATNIPLKNNPLSQKTIY